MSIKKPYFISIIGVLVVSILIAVSVPFYVAKSFQACSNSASVRRSVLFGAATKKSVDAEAKQTAQSADQKCPTSQNSVEYKLYLL